jgi:hypothetical protein
MAFGSKGTFTRQTGSNIANSKPYTTPFTAGEAWVFYGHLKLLDNQSANTTNVARFNPTNAGKNPPGFIPTTPNGPANMPANLIAGVMQPNNNFYATEWVLGRSATLLSTAESNGEVLDSNGAKQEFFPAPANKSYTQDKNTALAPLSMVSRTNDGTSTTLTYASFCDIADISLSSYRSIVEAAMFNTTTSQPVPTWYRPLISYIPGGTSRTIPNNPRPEHLARFHGCVFFSKALDANVGANNSALPRNMELMAPLFVKGCTQFMVEYAGDYEVQNAQGFATAVGEDGQIDFDIVNGARKIRWYGLTRSTDGSTDESPVNNPPSKPQLVHPLYKHLAAIGVNPLPFEKTGANAFPQTSYTDMDHYTCAWSPDDIFFDPSVPDPNGNTNNTNVWLKKFPSRTFLPWLIRITIRVDDPYGRLPDGQTMEFVYELPRPSL